MMSRYYGCEDCNGRVHRDGWCPKLLKLRERQTEEIHIDGEMTYEERMMAGTLMLGWRVANIFKSPVDHDCREESIEAWLYERSIPYQQDEEDEDIIYEDAVGDDLKKM